jgi:hypothetical protein
MNVYSAQIKFLYSTNYEMLLWKITYLKSIIIHPGLNFLCEAPQIHASGLLFMWVVGVLEQHDADTTLYESESIGLEI